MMNIRKFFKVRNYYLLLGVIMINVGCTKNFLEYNTNPNEATDEMTDWDNVRTGSLLLQMEQNVLVVAQPGLNIGSDRYQTVEVMGGDGYVGYFGFPAPSINQQPFRIPHFPVKRIAWMQQKRFFKVSFRLMPMAF